MASTIRTFVALEIAPAVRAQAAELIERLRALRADVKWVDPENLHVTLKFLGDVESGQIHQVCRAVEQAVADMPPFDFEVRGAGAFPSANRPQTVWLGIGQGQAEIVALNERIEPPLEKLGFSREARRFEPHLTIGRVRRRGPATDALGKRLREQAGVALGTTHAAEVVVFSSQLSRSGPTYEALARAPLARD